MKDGKKPPQHSKGGGTGRTSQLEGIHLNILTCICDPNWLKYGKLNEAVLAGCYINLIIIYMLKNF